jgi:hypothetical protein
MIDREMTVKIALSFLILAGTASVAAAQTPASPTPPAANPCAGVAESACPAVPGCVWLPGYKVKGGTDVQGYCRTAPKPLTSRRPGDVPKQ